MKRIRMAVVAALFTLTLPCQAQQGQAQGQGQQGQGRQGQGQQGQGQQVAKFPTPNASLRKFVFTLVLGDVQAGTGSNFTPAASKALADLKGFLPYKTYTLLDTVFKIGLTGPDAQVKGVGVGTMYSLRALGSGAASGVANRTSMRLNLWTVSGGEHPPTALIESQFEIEIGETVVVGTSRLDGNRALLLLVTSVP